MMPLHSIWGAPKAQLGGYSWVSKIGITVVTTAISLGYGPPTTMIIYTLYNMIRSLMTGTPTRSINAVFFCGVSAAVRLTLEAMQEQDHRDAVENSEVL